MERDDLETTGGGGLYNASKSKVNHAVEFVKTIKKNFQHKKELYEEFSNVMIAFKAKRIGISDVVAKVKELFKDNHDLLLKFNMFLPEGEDLIFPLNDAIFDEVIIFINKIKIKFGVGTVYRAFLDILNKYRLKKKSIADVYYQLSMLFQGYDDMVDGFCLFLPHFSSTSDTSSRYRHSDEKDGTPQTPTNRDITNVETDGNFNEEDKSKCKRKEKRGRESKDEDSEYGRHIIKKKNRGENIANGGFGKVTSHQGSSNHFNYGRDSSNIHTLCEKMKMKLRTPEMYQDFMRCIHLYTKGTLTRPQLMSSVSDLIHPDSLLMYSFSKYLDQCERKECTLDVFLGQGLACNGESFSNSLTNKGKDVVSNIEKFSSIPISEIDFQDSERCSPSYRLLPHDYPIPIASSRTALDCQVLNDLCVSVTSGSEDYSFKCMQKNQYEETIFRCEDDMFEMDILLKSVISTVKSLKKLQKFINEHKIVDGDFVPLGDFLTVLNLRLIERLYGDNGVDVIDVLKINPSLAVPVVLARLTQRRAEWKRCRTDCNVIWADIISENYQKSLDYSCSNLKLQDVRSFGTQSLLADVKHISEKKKKKADSVVELSASRKQPMLAHFTFEFPDDELHEDTFEVIKYSCEERCTTEQFEKVTKIWSSIMEPMLGLPPRATSSDSASTGDTAATSPNVPLDIVEEISAEPVIKRGYVDSDNNTRLFYGNDSFYLLFKYYQILYGRILHAKTSSGSKNDYTKFLIALFKLLDGSSDNAKYEDACRKIISTNSCLLFTMDKLIYKLIKLINKMAGDETTSKLLELHEHERSTSSFVDPLYYDSARAILLSGSLYRIQTTSAPTRVSIRVMD